MTATDAALEVDCHLCARERGAEPVGGWVYRDEYWSVGILDGFEVPGWVAIQLRRHTVGISGLTSIEQESLGPLLARLSGVLAKATLAERVYLTSYGEAYPHLHFVLMTRGADVPPAHRGPQLILNRSTYIDHPTATALAAKIRDLLSGAVRRRE